MPWHRMQYSVAVAIATRLAAVWCFEVVRGGCMTCIATDA